jgi:RNA polymerase sigma-70 factor (ECF subfamily)
MDDDELIRAVREGQAYAGPFLVSLYAPRILGQVRNVAGDLGDEACELICENAVERAIRGIDKYSPSCGTFIAWVRSMVKYAALDYRRDDARTQSLADLDVADSPPETSREMSEEVRAALAATVQKLSDADQAILALIDAEGLSAPTAAMLLGISHVAARQRHSRARRRLSAAASSDQVLIDFIEGRTS